MLTIGEENYPIISVMLEGASTLVETEQYLARFDHWLSQAQPFGIMMYQRDSVEAIELDQQEIERVHQFTIQWTKQNKSRIIQHCVGIALVIDDPEIVESRRKTAPKTITAIYGCPGQVFETTVDAKAWIQQQL